MATAQQRMEDSANKHRQPGIMFKVGDRVWLNLKNIQTPQQSEKLSWLNASCIHPGFHVDLLKIASTDPLPSQQLEDPQPPPTSEFGAPEHFVQRFCRSRLKKVGRGFQRQVLVKWDGYRDLTWEPREAFECTVALDVFEQKFGTGDDVGEENPGTTTGPRS